MGIQLYCIDRGPMVFVTSLLNPHAPLSDVPEYVSFFSAKQRLKANLPLDISI